MINFVFGGIIDLESYQQSDTLVTTSCHAYWTTLNEFKLWLPHFSVLRGRRVIISILTLSRLILPWKSIINWPWIQGWIPVSMIAGIITAPHHHSRSRI